MASVATIPAALRFDGTNDYVTFGMATNINNLGVTNFTIECWFKRQGTGKRGDTGSGGFLAIPLVTKGMAENEAPRTNMNFFFGIGTNSAGQTVLAADFEDRNNGLNHPVLGTGIVDSNVWVHGAATYDVGGSNWVLYLNGVPDATNIIAGPSGITNYNMLLPRYDSLQHAALASCLLVSGSTNSSSGFFAGTMDEVRIWNYARSAQEIADNYNRPVPSAAGLIARWPLNQTSGTVASNSVSGGVQGRLTNGPVWTDGYFLPPSVSITNPVDGATISGTIVTIEASASDTDGSVAKVEFYSGSRLLGEDTTEPYSYVWSGVAPGTYALSAVATDNMGLTTTSSGVNVTVTPVPGAGGLYFDGVNDYVTFGVASELGVTNFTIECWFKRQGAGVATTTGNGGISAVPLVTKGRGENEAGRTNMNFFLGFNTNGLVAADFEDKNNGLNHPITGSAAVGSNVWQHAAVTYQRDGTNGTWVLYLNGAPDQTNTFTGTNEFITTPEGASIQHAALATALNTAGVADGFFQGTLDEVRIWNYSRSAQEIADNYQAQIPAALGLLARWSLDEGAGLAATNSGESGVSGTLTNGPVWVEGYPLTVNGLPVAGDDARTAYMNLTATMPVSQLLTNDFDPDDDPLDITDVSATSTNGGTVVLALGNVNYTPVSGHLGSDLFTYTLADNRGGSATGHVFVQVQLPAVPTLNSRPTILTNGHFGFSLSATPEVPYTITVATNLSGPWEPLTNRMTDINGVLTIEDTTEPPPPMRFYRAVFP
jgi:hypothetical protein